MKPISHQATSLIGKERGLGALTHKSHMDCIRLIGEFMGERFGLQNINNLKTGHVQIFFREHAKLSDSRLEAYATGMRKIASAIGKENIMPRTNAELGIGRSVAERYHPKNADTERIADVRVALVSRAEISCSACDVMLIVAHDMRDAFGLRAKESLASREAIERDGRLYLRVEGTKGGRERELEIRSDAQRDAVAKVQALSAENGKSIIPPDMTLRQALAYQQQVIHSLGGTKSNFANMHCQRHTFAQSEYERHRNDGLERGMSPDEAKKNAMIEVSRELGHDRPEIVYHYVIM